MITPSDHVPNPPMEGYLAAVAARRADASPVSKPAKPVVKPRRTSALARLRTSAASGDGAPKPKPAAPALPRRPAPVVPVARRPPPPSAIRRAFDIYCERAQQSGSLSQSQLDTLAEHVARVDQMDDAEMRQILEEELCGAEVEVVGVTGRHLLGWWGDGTVGRVQVRSRSATLSDAQAFSKGRAARTPIFVPRLRVPTPTLPPIRAAAGRSAFRAPHARIATSSRPAHESECGARCDP